MPQVRDTLTETERTQVELQRRLETVENIENPEVASKADVANQTLTSLAMELHQKRLEARRLLERDKYDLDRWKESMTTLEVTLHEKITTAAHRIMDADVLYVTTGAGFSADSGLAVYVDVAKVPAYESRGLQYHDICQPHWLEAEPDLYWGFWGGCFNDYRATEPHGGYATIANWRDTFFKDTEVCRQLQSRQMETRIKEWDEAEVSAEPYLCSTR